MPVVMNNLSVTDLIIFNLPTLMTIEFFYPMLFPVRVALPNKYNNTSLHLRLHNCCYNIVLGTLYYIISLICRIQYMAVL